MPSLGDDGSSGEDSSLREFESPESASLSGSSPDLELELSQARAELEEYQRILNDLPGIYEAKFRQKFRSVTQQIRHLLDERKALQEQVSRALIQSSRPEALPPAAPSVPAGERASFQGGKRWSEVRLPRFPSSSSASPSFRLPRLSRSALRWSTPHGRQIGLVLGAGIALVLFGLGLPHLLNRRSIPAVDPALVPLGGERSPASTSQSLRVEARGGQSWVLVERLSGGVVVDSILEPGQSKVLPLGSGLRMRSGRPDLLYVSTAQTPAVPLGAVSDLDWFEFRP